MVLSLVGMVMLTGCTNGNNQTTPTVTPTSSEVVLIWWNQFEPQANVQPLIDAYTAQHPNVKIQYVEKGVTNGVDGYKAELDSTLTDSDPLNTPDIFAIQNNWSGFYEKYISMAPVSAIAESDLGDFYPTVKSDFFRDGAVEAVPLYLDTLALIYNKDKLINKGYTLPADQWSNLQIQAGIGKLTEVTSNNKISSAGFSAALSSNTEFNFELFNLLLMQNGVNMTDSNGLNATFATGSDAAKTSGALTFYRSFTSGSTQSWDVNQKKDIAAFLENHLAVYAAPSWRLIDVINYNQKYSLQLKIGTAQMPQLSGTDPVYYATYWGQTVSKDSSKAATAWDFIKFITQAEQLRLLNTTVTNNGRPIGILYPRASMASEITNPLLKPYVDSLAKAKIWNMNDGYTMKKDFDKFFTENSTDLTQLQSQATSVLQSK
jgi:multiple sugar transport system substrate-binding protein